MSDSLLDLESRRAAVQSQIAQLGDMRSGSITKPEDIVEIQTVIAIRPTILATAPTID